MQDTEKNCYFGSFLSQLITTTKHARIFLVKFQQSHPTYPPIAVVKVFNSYNQDQAREISILMHLAGMHRNLITLYHHMISRETCYIFMEHCAGGSLSKEINTRWRENRPWTDGELINLFSQLADGMSCIHSQKIIHRDIKPDNILIAADNLLKIADFGESKQVHQTAAEQLQTIRGTRAYMSPQLTGVFDGSHNWPKNESGYVDDVWAMGRTFYEMAVLETKPWMNTLHEMGDAKFQAYIRESLRKKEVMPALIRLIQDMLMVVPGARPDFPTIFRRLQVLSLRVCALCGRPADPSIPSFPCAHNLCHACYSSFHAFLEHTAQQTTQITCPKDDCKREIRVEELSLFPISGEVRERLKVMGFLEQEMACGVCGGRHKRMKESKGETGSVVSPYLIECQGQRICSYCGLLGGHFLFGIKRKCPSFRC